MGTFHYPVEIAATPQGPYGALDAVVDTGAFYTWIPASILRRLGIAPHDRRAFLLADGRQLERDVGRAWARAAGREESTIVVFGDEGTEPLLGAYTLEGLALAADPVNRRLVPMPRLYLLRAGPGQGRF